MSCRLCSQELHRGLQVGFRRHRCATTGIHSMHCVHACNQAGLAMLCLTRSPPTYANSRAFCRTVMRVSSAPTLMSRVLALLPLLELLPLLLLLLELLLSTAGYRQRRPISCMKVVWLSDVRILRSRQPKVCGKVSPIRPFSHNTSKHGTPCKSLYCRFAALLLSAKVALYVCKVLSEICCTPSAASLACAAARKPRSCLAGWLLLSALRNHKIASATGMALPCLLKSRMPVSCCLSVRNA